MCYRGGITVTAYGTDLNVIQEPRMYLELRSAKVRSKRDLLDATSDTRLEFPCTNATKFQMKCAMPKIPDDWLSTSGTVENISYGFILDKIEVGACCTIIYSYVYYVIDSVDNSGSLSVNSYKYLQQAYKV